MLKKFLETVPCTRLPPCSDSFERSVECNSLLHESFLPPCVSEPSSSDVFESTEVKVPVSCCLESSMLGEFSVAPLDDHVPRSTTVVIVSRSVQCETIDSFYTPKLDVEAPEFIPGHTDIPVFTT